MNKTKPILQFARWAIVLAALPLGVALASDETSTPRFGASVHNMIDQQIYDRNAAQQPTAEPPLSTDGERAAAVMKGYRTRGAAKPATSMTIDAPLQVGAP